MRPITCMLFCGLFLFPGLVLAQDSDTPIRVRVGEHAEFSRIVFDWPTRAPYRVEQADGRATVHFDRPGTLDLSRYERDPPPMVKDISPRGADGGLAVDIEIPQGAELRHFFNGTHVVVDVMRPRAGAVQRAAKPQPKPKPQPQPAATPEAPAAKAKPSGAAWSNQFATNPSAESSEQSAQQSDYMSRIIAGDGSRRRTTRTAENTSTSYNSLFDPHFTVGPNVSTLGLGAEAGIRLNDYFGLRIGANYFTYSTDREYEDVEYDADINLLSGGAVLDVYPFGRIFRVTGGVRYNANEVDLDSEPSSNVKIGGQTFTPSEVGKLEGDIDFNKVAPYAGLGFEGIFLDGNLSLAFDLGVLYQGKPEVSLDSNGTLANDPAFRDALKEEEDDIEDDISFLGFYPVVSLSANLRF